MAGRPLSSDKKLVPVSTHLHPDDYAAIERFAKDRRVPFAKVLRALIVTRIRHFKVKSPDTSLTL